MAPNETSFAVAQYDLAATLSSGQAFRWRQRGTNWESVIAGRWVALQQTDEGIHARTAVTQTGWNWLRHYLQTEIDFPAVLETFPKDEHLARAIIRCSGLRLLRQEPWECLASFILSSTKQIVQIQQIVTVLCQRFGDSVVVPAGTEPWFAFPSASRLAGCTESELRECKMGFRAPYLLAAAQMVAGGELDLNALDGRTVTEARAELIRVPGVGRKIADCVLLFAYGFPTAFPVDVWVMKALRELYFPKKRVKPPRLVTFSETYFGTNAGYAQQYLFHYMRTQHPKAKRSPRKAE